jgi:hypothetical protein
MRDKNKHRPTLKENITPGLELFIYIKICKYNVWPIMKNNQHTRRKDHMKEYQQKKKNQAI